MESWRHRGRKVVLTTVSRSSRQLSADVHLILTSAQLGNYGPHLESQTQIYQKKTKQQKKVHVFQQIHWDKLADLRILYIIFPTQKLSHLVVCRYFQVCKMRTVIVGVTLTNVTPFANVQLVSYELHIYQAADWVLNSSKLPD